MELVPAAAMFMLVWRLNSPTNYGQRFTTGCLPIGSSPARRGLRGNEMSFRNGRGELQRASGSH